MAGVIEKILNENSQKKVRGVNTISNYLKSQKHIAFGVAKDYEYLYLVDSTKNNASCKSDVVLLKNDPEEPGSTRLKLKRGSCYVNLDVTRLKLEGKVLISEDENAFYLRKANKSQIARFSQVLTRQKNADANIGAGGHVLLYSALTEEQRGLIGKYDEIRKVRIVCNEHDGAYVIFRRLSPKKQKAITKEQFGLEQANKLLERCGVFEGYCKGELRFPLYFRRFTNLERYDKLEVVNLEDGIMVLAKPGRCRVCGAPIKRDKGMRFIHMCKACETAAPVAYEAMKSNGGTVSLAELDDHIAEMREMLNKLNENA